MQKKYLSFILLLISAVFLGGCNQQAKENSKKIDLLAQTIIQVDQSQAKQMTALQAQLASLAPMLEKANGTYFEKNRDDALFFHTNTLYLLLTIGKQIEAQLRTADSERESQIALEYSYHTNQLSALSLCTAQVQNALASQEARLQAALANRQQFIETNINAATERQIAVLNESLLKQIKASTQPDANEAAQRTELLSDVAQIQRDLDAIKTRLSQLSATPAATPSVIVQP
ncbi:MAG TPA: hypothetical protein VGO57_08690 [Verrucomicrobiae bacterium]